MGIKDGIDELWNENWNDVLRLKLAPKKKRGQWTVELIEEKIKRLE